MLIKFCWKTAVKTIFNTHFCHVFQSAKRHSHTYHFWLLSSRFSAGFMISFSKCCEFGSSITGRSDVTYWRWFMAVEMALRMNKINYLSRLKTMWIRKWPPLDLVTEINIANSKWKNEHSGCILIGFTNNSNTSGGFSWKCILDPCNGYNRWYWKIKMDINHKFVRWKIMLKGYKEPVGNWVWHDRISRRCLKQFLCYLLIKYYYFCNFYLL